MKFISSCFQTLDQRASGAWRNSNVSHAEHEVKGEREIFKIPYRLHPEDVLQESDQD